MKRRFEKIYNREMPLFSMEYWYQGEYYGLPKITNKLIYYNPLFVYRKNRATDVYYDVTNYQEDDNKLIFSYFQKYPEKFKKIANQYKKECKELLRLVKLAKPKDFSKIFNLHVSFWSKFSVIISLAELVKDKPNQITKRAYKLRQETEKVEYISGNNLIKLVEQLLPDFKEFIYFLTFEEIISKKIPSKKELIKRKNKYIYFEGKIYTDLSIKQFEKLKKIRILEDNNENNQTSNTIKGTIAMTGKVKGIARIIFKGSQSGIIKKGDIIVSPMTTPDYIMANMKKAAAFITNEGGLTCHAAIVAREIKKPCIIGTKNATQVIRDGDLIEVDANHGIVKILKKKNSKNE